MYPSAIGAGFEFMTKSIRTLGNRPRYFPVSPKDTDPPAGSARIAAYAALPEVLTGFGVDLADVLDAARLPSNIFDDPESRISYADVGRLVAVSVQQTKCDHIGLLIGQGSGLAAMGLVGQIALCADTVGEGLQNFARFFTLQNTAATVDVITSGAFTRLVYAIAEPGMADTSQLQLGAMAIAFNILQDLCGPEWLPTAITVASSAPSNLRPCQKFFRAPLRFDSNESSIIFESHWLDRPLPPMDSQERMRIEAELQAQRAAIMADYTATVRRIVRKQLLIGGCSMDYVAAQLDIHRRSLDRQLKRHGVLFGEVLDSVKHDVACQLLRGTSLQVQQVAESLHYSSAANFCTAFRRWTGVTPTEYRRGARLQVG